MLVLSRRSLFVRATVLLLLEDGGWNPCFLVWLFYLSSMGLSLAYYTRSLVFYCAYSPLRSPHLIPPPPVTLLSSTKFYGLRP
ncbi:hypothetical protein GY45DRAFT_2740 [Cubamyces sp. BRFM 1775]|nr:hypothetical protein GY45DRAFT_2740 [Cubamyces sp. BRFM 1775]